MTSFPNHSLPRRIAGIVMVLVFVEALYGYVYGTLGL